jgi:hypothetical protein
MHYRSDGSSKLKRYSGMPFRCEDQFPRLFCSIIQLIQIVSSCSRYSPVRNSTYKHLALFAACPSTIVMPSRCLVSLSSREKGHHRGFLEWYLFLYCYDTTLIFCFRSFPLRLRRNLTHRRDVKSEGSLR